MKFIGIILLAVAAVSPAQAQQAGDIKMEYHSLSPVDPSLAPYWQDYIQDIPADGAVPASLMAQTFPTSAGGQITVSMFTGSGMCGLHQCPIRIIEDGAIIDYFDACNAPDNHYMAADASTFTACGEVREIGRNPIPAPN